MIDINVYLVISNLVSYLYLLECTSDDTIRTSSLVPPCDIVSYVLFVRNDAPGI